MKYFVGAYAASPNQTQWDAVVETAFYQALQRLPNVKGLEHPFLGSLHPHDDAWFLANIDPNWHYVFTCIPGIMNALGQNPQFGLASTDEQGRQAALQFTQRACEAIAKLNHYLGRKAVTAIQIQTAPARNKAYSSVQALEQSLHTMLQWDWQGAKIVIEHCDALMSEHEPSKGFLALQDELALLTRLNETLPSQQKPGMVINWGRSVFETRQVDGALEHIKQAKAEGVLAGLMFSGVSDEESEFGAWRDSHQPPQQSALMPLGEPGSWLTEQAMHVCLAASDAASLAVLGVKIGIRPHNAGIDQRLATISQTLAMMERYFAAS